MLEPSAIAEVNVWRYGAAAAVLTSYVRAAGELGETWGRSLDNPMESLKLRLYSRLHAILFGKQASDISGVREPGAVPRVRWDGLIGHGGELSWGAKQAPLWVLV